MNRTRQVFEVVAIKATKRWKDADGKNRQKTVVFSQTINPFNVNGDGSIKSREQIMKEITDARDRWVGAKP